ncbi:MAG: single-stranded DNA-binding protein [Bacteroidota bacterium]
MGVNKVILVGNVGKDPEVQYIKEDVPVARFTLATSETYKDKNGEKVTNTEWHNIVVWRGLAKVVENYVKKGSQLYIEGKISNRSYEKDGVTKYFTEIVANSLQMLGSKGDNAGSSQQQQQNSTPTTVNEPKTEDLTEDIGGDDLPF